MTEKLGESISKEFELVEFISRYAKGSVYFKRKSKTPEVIVKGNAILTTVRIDKNGTQYQLASKGGTDQDTFTKALQKNFKEEYNKHQGLEKIDFIKAQIRYIKSIDPELKKQYETVVGGLKRHFKNALRELKNQNEKTAVANNAEDQKPNKAKPSYTVYAMALHLKKITLDKKGIGVNDRIDYAKKFALRSGVKLYNCLNGIQNEKLADPKHFEEDAKKVIERYHL